MTSNFHISNFTTRLYDLADPFHFPDCSLFTQVVYNFQQSMLNFWPYEIQFQNQLQVILLSLVYYQMEAEKL